MGYSVEMRESVIKKVLVGEKTHDEIAMEAGISKSTLGYWLKHYKKDVKIKSEIMERRPRDWSATGVLKH